MQLRNHVLGYNSRQQGTDSKNPCVSLLQFLGTQSVPWKDTYYVGPTRLSTPLPSNFLRKNNQYTPSAHGKRRWRRSCGFPLGNAVAIAQAITRVAVINTIAGNGTAGVERRQRPCRRRETERARTAWAIDNAANLYIADPANNRIREVAAGTNIVSTFAGNGTAGFGGDGGPATSAELQSPVGVAVDSAGNLYIADQGNNVIRKVANNGTITTVAGNNAEGYSGDNGQATNATLYAPAGVALDSAGNLYIADQGNNRVRMVNTTGTITTFAGTGTAGYGGDNGRPPAQR